MLFDRSEVRRPGARSQMAAALAMAAGLSIMSPLGAQAGGGCHDYVAIGQIQQDLQQAAPLFGASHIRIEQSGLPTYQNSAGLYNGLTVVGIASATKTLSAAVMMSLVDSGMLALDDRVGAYLPEWNVGLKQFVTLRQCFALTSGMVAEHPSLTDPALTLREAAMAVANAPIQNVPGTTFAYGGPSMHVAGAVCEVVGGQSFATLFQQRIAGPLGMLSTDYLGSLSASAANPLIAGGARSNARDFARFMAMLRNGGVFAGTQVLSAASVDEMLTDQTSGLPILETPHPRMAPYGLGIWIDRQDSNGATLLANGMGAFGFAGWVDRAHDSSGVLSIFYGYNPVYAELERVWLAIDDAMLPVGVACSGAATPPCAPDAWLNANRAPQAGQLDFAIRASRVQPGTIGVLAIGDDMQPGLPFFDIDILLQPGFVIADAVLADANGRATIPAPIAPGLTGQTFALQAAWFTIDPCTLAFLQASHALLITVP